MRRPSNSHDLDLIAPVSVIVTSYVGTLTQLRANGSHVRRDPRGSVLAAVMHEEFGLDLAEEAIHFFDARLSRYQDEATGRALPELIRVTFASHDLVPPRPPDDIAAKMLETVGDHPIDPEAATALTTLHDRGYPIVLAANSIRPRELRAKTLAEAALGYVSIVLSSSLGVRKPHTGFYEHVRRHCGVDAAEVLWVGYDPIADVAGPVAEGMQAVYVDSWDRARGNAQRALRLGAAGVITHISELVDHLVIAPALHRSPLLGLGQ